MNKAVLVGRITADPKIDIVNNKKRARFTVALQRKFSKDMKIDYISCTAQGHNAEFIEKNFTRGNNISIVGELHTKKHENDNKTYYSTCVSVEEVSYIRPDTDFSANERGASDES